MPNNHSYCIIMAGGIGSRFWPVSRAGLPKQFLDFNIQGRSFLRRTFDRMKTLIPEENILVVSLGVGCYFLLQGNLPNPEVQLTSPALGHGFFTPEPLGKPIKRDKST